MASTRVAAIAAAAFLILGCTKTEERPSRTPADLMASRSAENAARAVDLQKLTDRFLERIVTKAKQGAGRPTIDLLVISGGGDWGAFGAGVLKGWGRVKGELARPEFDVVTGVSTGALIAPFAFLGDERSIDQIAQLYRNPQSDIAVSRGMLFFLPNNPSFYALPGLERELHRVMDRAMLERLAAQESSGRVLLVNTTNIDLGEMRAWNLIAEARTALTRNDAGHVHRIVLASAGIPGIFPARGIGEYLYVDGAITGNILYAGRTEKDSALPTRWKAAYPAAPLPRMRYWVIFNNQVRFPPQITAERWPDLLNRATIMSTQTSTVNSIRHLYALAEIERLKQRADVEVRLISVPEDWVPAKPGTFVKEVMNDLADLGERMGADPASWRTEAP
jgi:predicted acylesterase/phospholipase RssA